MPAQGTEPLYLHNCLNEFPEICRKKYGKTFDLKAVENKVKELRRRGTSLRTGRYRPFYRQGAAGKDKCEMDEPLGRAAVMSSLPQVA